MSLLAATNSEVMVGEILGGVGSLRGFGGGCGRVDWGWRGLLGGVGVGGLGGEGFVGRTG